MSIRLPLISPAALSPEPPRRRIASGADIAQFERSEGYRRLLAFIDLLNEGSWASIWASNERVEEVEGDLVIPDRRRRSWESENVVRVLKLIDTCTQLKAQHPPIQESQRFGNKAFRGYVQAVHDSSREWHDSLLEPHLPNSEERTKAIEHLLPYFNQSWGSGSRLDYGSGHELSFVCWLCGLYCLGYFQKFDANSVAKAKDHAVDPFSSSDEPALALRVFPQYLTLVRELQLEYRLEPAGSHGVWGLDDYQALCYLFGSAQLVDQPRGEVGIYVRDVLDSRILDRSADKYGDDFLYLAAIRHIYRSKRGPFAEHSPVLYSVANTVSHWRKVNQGMRKMWLGEVLAKAAVVQHLPLGEQPQNSLLPWSSVTSSPARPPLQIEVKEDAVPPVGGTKAPWASQTERSGVGNIAARTSTRLQAEDSADPASVLAKARRDLQLKR